ncbi:MAG: hypothetical protein AB7D05_04520 [Mangrovibacterium sp.]
MLKVLANDSENSRFVPESGLLLQCVCFGQYLLYSAHSKRQEMRSMERLLPTLAERVGKVLGSSKQKRRGCSTFAGKVKKAYHAINGFFISTLFRQAV